MATFYGSDSVFIKGKQKRRRNLLIFLIILLIVVSAILYFAYRHLWVTAPLGALLLFALTKEMMAETVKDANATFWRLRKMKGWSDRGLLGERIIKEKLEALPDSYSVFRGFRPNEKNDIDFIVVGPNGLFSIEVKSQTGKLTYKKGSYGNKLLWQAKREAQELSTYFRDGWRITAWVTAILVFARSGAKIPEMEQPKESVYIIKADQLVTTILRKPGVLKDQEAITTRLQYFFRT